METEAPVSTAMGIETLSTSTCLCPVVMILGMESSVSESDSTPSCRTGCEVVLWVGLPSGLGWGDGLLLQTIAKCPLFLHL